MSKMIQIRNVPDTIHRRLKARAAEAGLSLSEYLLQELRESVSRPTPKELRARLLARPPVRPSVPVVEAVRRERDSR
jgi:antitoxin FitA